MNEIFFSEFAVQADESFVYSKNKDLILLNDLQGRETRNIAIMYSKIEQRKGTRYLLIIGVDIFSKKLVRLVDTYGKQYGLCKYCDDLKNVRCKTVIKVPCKICDGPYLNTLRIVGNITIIGKTDFGKLLAKFHATQTMDCLFFPYSKIGVPCFMSILNNNPGKEFYAHVYVSSTIKKHKNSKYQVKFSFGEINRFVDILDEKFIKKNHNLDGKFIKGMALAKGVLIDGAIRAYIVEVQGHHLYESKLSYDKRMLQSLSGHLFDEGHIERLLDEGYTARSESFPGPEMLGDLSNSFYDEPPFDMDILEYESFEDADILMHDRSIDYGYMEDEDYED